MSNLNEILNISIINNSILNYSISLLIILGSFILTRTIGSIIRKKAKKRLWKILKGPIYLGIYILAIKLATDILNIPSQYQKYIANIISIAIISVTIYLLIKLVDFFSKNIEKKIFASQTKLDDQLWPVLKKSIKIIIILLGTVVALDNIGINVTSIIAGLGIGGIAIALAAQDTLKNLFGSVTIFSDQPFNIDDRVKFDEVDAVIKEIGFRSTKLETLDGTMVTVPNSKIADAAVENISKRPYIKNVYTIGITYDTSYEKTQQALNIIRTTLKNHPSTDNYWAYFKTFAAYSLDILVIHWCKHTAYENFLIATEEINMTIKKEFEAAGIEFAFPTQTLHVNGLPGQAG